MSDSFSYKFQLHPPASRTQILESFISVLKPKMNSLKRHLCCHYNHRSQRPPCSCDRRKGTPNDRTEGEVFLLSRTRLQFISLPLVNSLGQGWKMVAKGPNPELVFIENKNKQTNKTPVLLEHRYAQMFIYHLSSLATFLLHGRLSHCNRDKAKDIYYPALYRKVCQLLFWIFKLQKNFKSIQQILKVYYSPLMVL